MESIRLNKYLSEQGVCSRREADELIGSGAVTVDGKKAVMGERIWGTEKICVSGKVLKQNQEDHIYILLNKPRGIVCTTKNDKNNVIDYLSLKQRVFPVGRLDKDSEGLLMLTNDGDIVNRMMRSSNGHEKEYEVTVNRPVTREFLKAMSDGVWLEELQVKTRPCKLTKTSSDGFNIILTQGYNRQIRRMCLALGYRVRTLKRIRIMNIKLGDLKTGQWRYTTQAEMKALKQAISCRQELTKK